MSAEEGNLVRGEEAEALVSWLEAFPSRTLQMRLSDLIEQRRKLDTEIHFLQAQLIRYRQYLQDLAEPGESEVPTRDRAIGGNAAIHARAAFQGTSSLSSSVAIGATGPAQPEYPPKRQAVFRLLAENAFKEWKLAELREEMIRRGWLADDDKARHALQMLMLNMAKRGEIDKPATGIYRAMVKVPQDQTDEEAAEEAEALYEDSG